MESDEETIVNFVKDHEALYNKTNEHFKDKARKECLWERLANSRKLSVKVCNTWFKLQRLTMANSCSSSLVLLKKNDKGTELDSE